MMVGFPLCHYSDGAVIDLDFLSALPAGANFTRASTGWYFDSNGLLVSAANDTPRFDYGTPGSTTPRGLLMEEAKTNKVIQCRDLTQAAWTTLLATVALNQTGIDGVANTASSMTATSANATTLQTITEAATSSAFSVYLKRLAGTGTIQITQDGGTSWTTVALTSAWQRFSLIASVLNPAIGIRIVTSGDSIGVDVAQFEQTTPLPTSPILTTTAAVTRAADSCQVANIPWYNPTYGTFYVEFYKEATGGVTNNHNLFSVSDNSTANIFRAGQLDTTNTIFTRVTKAGVSANPGNTAAYTAGVNKYGLVYAAGTSKTFAMLNAGTALTSSPASFPALATLTDGLRLGCTPPGVASSFSLNGNIRKFKYWNYALPSAILQKVTT